MNLLSQRSKSGKSKVRSNLSRTSLIRKRRITRVSSIVWILTGRGYFRPRTIFIRKAYLRSRTWRGDCKLPRRRSSRIWESRSSLKSKSRISNLRNSNCRQRMTICRKSWIVIALKRKFLIGRLRLRKKEVNRTRQSLSKSDTSKQTKNGFMKSWNSINPS